MAQNDPYEPVAIIGLGCRFPGGASAPAALWRLLLDGRDAVGQPTDVRAAQWMPAVAPNAARQPAGYLDDVAGFDADFFGVSRREADVLDPQHRLLVEVAWEALEHAGLPPHQLDGTPTGMFLGVSYNDYMEGLAGLPQEAEGSLLTNGHCVAAGRISYLLGLHGPSIALDTACSSGLVATHLACQALRSGECDTALAGGVTLMLTGRTTATFARMGMLSQTGRCHTFDAAADGFVRGEGCGVVVLKRLADAVRDEDRVLAVIRGSAVNQDGRSDGLAAPSATAQAALFREALARSQADPGDVGLVESHGTGTPVGDPVEFTSVAEVYGQGRDRCALGSLKTNLGHLEPASGIAGLIKAVLSLQHGLVPGNLHFTRWNDAIDPTGTRLFVPTELTDWPVRNAARLAAVSSFGYSGTNAHIVVEQAPAVPGRRRGVPARPEADGSIGSIGPIGPDVLLVPAGSERALPAAATRLADWMEGEGADVPLGDVGHTLALRRPPGRGRLGVIASSRGGLVDGLRAFASGEVHPGVVSGSVGTGISRRPLWVFSGQGSQWSGMGRALLEREPAFAAALAEADAAIAAEAGFSVLDIVRDGERVSGCGRVQPVLFAMQVALAALWRSYGVEPAGVAGHSMGEVAAAVVAGALSLHDGARVICRRSALLTRIAGAGAMASVALDHTAVEQELAALGAAVSVSVAVLAAPGSTVVAGDTRSIERLVSDWDSRGIPARLVAVDVASHSPQVDGLLDDLASALADLSPRQPDVPFYSTVLDDPRETPAFDAAYWCANLRRPVRFAAAMAAAAADRHGVVVEVSPHPVVTRAVSDGMAGLAADPVVVPTLRRGEDDAAVFRTQLAALHCAGVAVDLRPLYGDAVLADVPVITFDRQPHWAESGMTRPAGIGDGTRLPGVHAVVPGPQVRHVWSGDAGTAAMPSFADHRVHGEPVLPGAAYAALVLTAACEVFDAPPEDVEVRDVRFLELLRLEEHTEISTTVTLTAPDRAECGVYSRGDDGEWIRQADCVLVQTGARSPRASSPVDPAVVDPAVVDLAAAHPVVREARSLYEGMRACGVEHDGVFAAVTDLRTSDDGTSVWADITVPEDATGHGLRVEPVLLDACAQALTAGVIHHASRARRLLLPVAVESIRLHGDPGKAVSCHARLTERSDEVAVGDVSLLDTAGIPVADLTGLRIVLRGGEAPAPADRWFLEPRWHTAPRAPSSSPGGPGRWLVVADDDERAEAVASRLRTAGASVGVLDLPALGGPLDGLREALAGRLAEETETPRGVAVLCAPTPGAHPTGAGLERARGMLAVAQALAARYPDAPRLYAVTCGAHSVVPGEAADPGQGAVRGVMRVLAYEHPDMRPTQIDVTTGDIDAGDVADELLGGAAEDEVALRGGARHVARLVRAPLSDAERAAGSVRTVRYGHDAFRLRAGRLGDLDGLELVAALRRDPGPGDVEVRVRAAGMNFRDVLTAMGMLPAAVGDDVRYRIGFECAGVVTAVGDGVTHVRPGDRVLAIDLCGGAFGSFVVVPAASVAPVPTMISDAEAAGLPAVFLTAWYALRHVARLRAGERVLIHSATGGTGQAAIAVARLLGAEVLATAGSEDKRRRLRESGIVHVMDSRTLDFAAEVRAATGGEGVDVVLNSLSGAAIRAGLETLRPFGRFVELGVRDILADAPLGMAPLRHNITLSSVDLIELQQGRPDLFAELLCEVMDEFAAGRLQPPPCRTFPLAEATDAFRLMAAAGHLGKLVLTVPDEGETTAVLPAGPPQAHSDGAYVVTGGLRGVGLATVGWLAREGAGHIVVNGRTPASEDARLTLRSLEDAGTRITVVLGDIAESGVAERLVAAATADGLRLRGVVHSAMVLDDAAITNVTEDQLTRVWRPKVHGAWRLHEALDGHRPDWFVVYSSMASLLGNPGQGAYAAANAWLDAFAAWRSAEDLPTLAVNWGAWGEIGAATDFADRGYETIPTREGLRALHALLAHGRVRTGVIPGEPDTWILPAVQKSSLFEGLAAEGRTDTGRQDGDRQGDAPDIRDRLDALEPGLARRTALEGYVAGHIRAVLRLGSSALDPETPLRALGFDSLLSIELRTRLEAGLGVKLANNFVWQHPTLAALAGGVAEQIGLDLHGAT